jgi:hypothetical protein
VSYSVQRLMLPGSTPERIERSAANTATAVGTTGPSHTSGASSPSDQACGPFMLS